MLMHLKLFLTKLDLQSIKYELYSQHVNENVTKQNLSKIKCQRYRLDQIGLQVNSTKCFRKNVQTLSLDKQFRGQKITEAVILCGIVLGI